ncbi:MAG: hypothetical protein IPH49_05050 [Ignavibacteria bacterium]|nr:hypothetical protein [Ignavibacteria bacterium]
MTLDDVNPEWLTAAEPNNTSAYYFDRNDAAFPNTLNMTGLEETVDSLDGMGPMIPNNNPRIFGGGLSMRTIAREVTDRLLAMRTNLGRSTIANQGDPLFNLRLRGWYGKSFLSSTASIRITFPLRHLIVSLTSRIFQHVLSRATCGALEIGPTRRLIRATLIMKVGTLSSLI